MNCPKCNTPNPDGQNSVVIAVLNFLMKKKYRHHLTTTHFLIKTTNRVLNLKEKHGCLIAIIVVVVLFIGIGILFGSGNSNDSGNSESGNKKETTESEKKNMSMILKP